MYQPRKNLTIIYNPRFMKTFSECRYFSNSLRMIMRDEYNTTMQTSIMLLKLHEMVAPSYECQLDNEKERTHRDLQDKDVDKDVQENLNIKIGILVSRYALLNKLHVMKVSLTRSGPDAVVPWESLRLPYEVDGSSGALRAPRRSACSTRITITQSFRHGCRCANPRRSIVVDVRKPSAYAAPVDPPCSTRPTPLPRASGCSCIALLTDSSGHMAGRCRRRNACALC